MCDRLFCNAQKVAPKRQLSTTAAAPARTFRESLVTRGRSARRRIEAGRSGSLSPIPRTSASSALNVSPVGPADPNGLLMFTAHAKLCCGEQPIDDVVILPHTIIDELTIALGPMTNSGGASPCAIPLGISM